MLKNLFMGFGCVVFNFREGHNLLCEKIEREC